MAGHYDLLLFIAKKGGLYKEIKSSTSDIAKAEKVSQQTISRKLRDMENLGFITRVANTEGVLLSIDKKGREFLKNKLDELNSLFRKISKITGVVKKGIGEGGYYVGLAGYQKQIIRKLGFKPFPGTLNLSVDEIMVKEFLENETHINIEGFKTGTRTFGSLKVYKIWIRSIVCAIILPERSRYDEKTIEVIAPFKLREKLKLKDGDEITLKIKEDDNQDES